MPSAPLRRRILITGASSGLGQEMARQWAAMGRDLALCARRTDELERLRDELLARHPDRQVHVSGLDVTDPAAVDRVVAEAAAALGGLDRVVANAGIHQGGAIGTGHAAGNRATVQTNVIGVLNTAETALATFRRQGYGHLVLMSSVAAQRGLAAQMAVYSATKAAVASLAEGIAGDLAGTPLRVTSIHPGYIKTDILSMMRKVMLAADLQTGVHAIIAAIETERRRAFVPALPWAVLARVMRVVPLRMVHRLS